MKQRSGRKRSPLDDIRPEAWTATLTTELLERLWVLEATIEMQSSLDELLAAILAAPTLDAADLPQPDSERQAPGHYPEDQTQTGWAM